MVASVSPVTITPTQFAGAELLVRVDELEPEAWMPAGDDVYSLPLMFDTRAGTWVSLLRVERSGFVERHRHPNPVTGWTLEGSWGYEERDWVARPGTFIYEPAGDIHTLHVHTEAARMLALFHVYGPLLYVDEHGSVTGYDDVFVRLERYVEHCESVGLGSQRALSLVR